MTDLVQLDALGPCGAYRAKNRLTLHDVAGTPAAELSLVPPLFVHRSLAALRKAVTMPPRARADALARAASLFSGGVLNGLSAAEHEHLVSRVSGTPIAVVRCATKIIARRAADACRDAESAKPDGAAAHWRHPSTRRGSGLWARRGNVFAVRAAGHHPAVHSFWLSALALGYRLILQPSRHDPFTPHRLLTALREADFGHDDQLAFVPTDPAATYDIVHGADRSVVYGGDDVVNEYRGSPSVLTPGPGRTKILVTRAPGRDWSRHLDTIVDSICQEGGTTCVNTSAVFVEGDPTPVAEAIAERLAKLPNLPPEHDRAVLPVQPLSSAQALEKHLFRCAEGAVARLGGDGIAFELGDGSAVLRPAVFQLSSATAPQARIELGFPCVWVAPWSPADGIEPLKNSLVLTAITEDEALIGQLMDEPTIRNVYIGDHPTSWLGPGMPHDGYLAEFLMRTKSVIRD